MSHVRFYRAVLLRDFIALGWIGSQKMDPWTAQVARQNYRHEPVRRRRSVASCGSGARHRGHVTSGVSDDDDDDCDDDCDGSGDD